MKKTPNLIIIIVKNDDFVELNVKMFLLDDRAENTKQ